MRKSRVCNTWAAIKDHMDGQTQSTNIHPQALVEMLGQAQMEILALRSAILLAREQAEAHTASKEPVKKT
jgi:hypothetical protein